METALPQKGYYFAAGVYGTAGGEHDESTKQARTAGGNPNRTGSQSGHVWHTAARGCMLTCSWGASGWAETRSPAPYALRSYLAEFPTDHQQSARLSGNSQPNVKWLADIIYSPMAEGWLYLAGGDGSLLPQDRGLVLQYQLEEPPRTAGLSDGCA